MERANKVRAAIKRAYDYDNTTTRINVEAEDIAKAKRITDSENGIIFMGRL